MIEGIINGSIRISLQIDKVELRRLKLVGFFT
jgi:hypothetical protein